MSTDRIALIKAQLNVLEPSHLELRDDSAQHRGHAGAAAGGGHFALLIVSAHFVGKTLLQRQRLVYSTLSSLMNTEIHALSIKACTPDEFANKPLTI
jgi:BolA protein